MITYYTDGSASPNPGPGGFAVIKNGQPYLIGGEPSGEITTNIRMEGLAIKAALADAAGAECQIYSDSEFWINVITKWAPNWQANGWKKKGGEIKNLDIVQEVYPLYQAAKATLTWVRGHEGDEGNELADEWANKARERKVREVQLVEGEVVELTPALHAKSILDTAQVMQIATVTDQGPRVNSVYFAVSDEGDAVYWMSEPRRRHSVDCEKDPHMAGAIAYKTDYPVRGLQFTGVASVVTEASEVERMSSIYGDKYHGFGKDLPERIAAGTNRHLLYKMDITSLELFDEVNYPGGEVITVF